MRNEDYIAQEHKRFSHLSGIEKQKYAYEQSKEGAGKTEEKPLNQAIPLSALYKSLVKHYAQQNRYIDKLEDENKKLKAQVEDGLWKIQVLKDKYEHTEVGEVYAKLEESEKRRKNVTKMFEGFIANHKAKDVVESDIEGLIEQFKELTEISE